MRSEFNVDPDSLTDAQFVDLWIEGAWLLNHKADLLAKRLGLTK